MSNDSFILELSNLNEVFNVRQVKVINYSKIENVV